MLSSATPSCQHRFLIHCPRGCRKTSIRVRFPQPEVEAAVGLDEMIVGSLVVEVAYANRESWGL